MTAFEIRPATADDLPSIQRVYAYGDAFHAASVPRFFRPYDGPSRPRAYLSSILEDDEQVLLVGVRGDAVVGLLHLLSRQTPDLPFLVPRRYVEVDAIVVLPEAQRGGLGQALMAEAEVWALARGIGQVELTVWEFNERAQAFYEALGFEPSRRRLWKAL